MKVKSKIGILFASLVSVVALTGAPAQAAGLCSNDYANCYNLRDALYQGAKWYAYIQIKASVNDAGRHSKQAWIRFQRNAGPSLDTGKQYTSVATSASDTTVRSRELSVWDSLLWGDAYTTNFSYSFVWW